MGGGTHSGCGDLRDRRHGLAPVSATYGAAQIHSADPARQAAQLGPKGYGWLQPRLSPIARVALPPKLTVEYLEKTRGALDFNRPGLPMVASLPSVHIAESYGRVHSGREATASAIAAWASEHKIPVVDLKQGVGEEVFSAGPIRTESTGTLWLTSALPN